MEELSRVLKHSGFMVVFEHNPFNPLTRWMVSRSPLDVNANLMRAAETKKIMENKDFCSIRSEYFMFFPPRIRILSSIERLFFRIPFGGQYVVFGQKTK